MKEQQQEQPKLTSAQQSLLEAVLNFELYWSPSWRNHNEPQPLESVRERNGLPPTTPELLRQELNRRAWSGQ